MNAGLQALLDDFVQRHDGLRLAMDSQGQVVLLCDEHRIVNFIDEADSGLLWALAMAGRLSSPLRGTAEPPDYGDEWISVHA